MRALSGEDVCYAGPSSPEMSGGGPRVLGHGGVWPAVTSAMAVRVVDSSTMASVGAKARRGSAGSATPRGSPGVPVDQPGMASSEQKASSG